MRFFGNCHLQYKVALSLLLILLALYKTEVIAATSQVEISPQEGTTHDAYLLMDNLAQSGVSYITLNLPLGLQKGYVGDEGIKCKEQGEDEFNCEVNGLDILSKRLHFRWDSRKILTEYYCADLAGEKQLTQSWLVRFAFKSSQHVYPRTLSLGDVSVQESNLADTYADFTTKDAFTLLWKSNSLVGNYVGSYVVDKNKLGLTAKKAHNIFGFFALSTQSKSIDIQKATLQVCSVSELEKATYDLLIRAVSYTNGESEALEETLFSPIQFTYDGILLQNDPSPTPTTTPTPSITLTLTPTPTSTQIIVTSSPPSVTPTSGTVTVTPTFTPTLAPKERETNASVLGLATGGNSEKKDEKSGVVEKGGEVLGAQRKGEMNVDTHKKIPLVHVVVITILSAFGLGALAWKRWLMHKFFVLILTVGLVWIGTGTIVSATPIVLTKLTDSYSYPPHVPWQVYKHYSKPYTLTNTLTNGKIVVSSTPDGVGQVNITNGAVNIWHFLNNISVGSNTIGFSDYTKTPCGVQQSYNPIEFPAAYGLKGSHSLTVRFFNHCTSNHAGSDMYLVFVPNVPTATPTITPTSTPTVTPTPTTVPPFLDLPWDYKSKKITFTEAALAMTSYFDHEYPMLSIGGSGDAPGMKVYSSGLVDFDKSYSSHDGYDFGKLAKANYGDPQLAAAAGVATYHNECSPCGNAIHIDHRNGFQTRYYHLDPVGLITNTVGVEVPVAAGQQIGRTGFTGRIIPASQDGAHVHFMVVFDKNGDGNFADNIPDGLADPYGWQGAGADPWEAHTFEYPAKHMRTGMKSVYLWKHSLAGATETVGVNGGEVKTEKVKVVIPPLTLPNILDFFIKSVPRQKKDERVESLGSGAEITAKDGTGNMVKAFAQPLTIQITFDTKDAKKYKKETLSIYSSPDGALWQKEQTLIDHDAGVATTTVDHLTLFALMGERADSTAPSTTLTLEGIAQNNTFRSAVTLNLTAQDESIEGLEYTLYKLDSGDWQQYTGPLTVTEEGEHVVEYFSQDENGNVENAQHMDFMIDTTPTEITFLYHKESKKMHFYLAETDIEITPQEAGEADEYVVTASDEAGNTLTLRYKEEHHENTNIWGFVEYRYNENSSTTDDMYVLTSGEQEGEMNEFVRSAGSETRVLTTSNNVRVYVGPDGTITSATDMTLQLYTDNGTLKIHEQQNP